MKQVEHFIFFEIVVFFLPPARFLYLTLDVAKVNMVFTTSRNVEKHFFFIKAKKLQKKIFGGMKEVLAPLKWESIAKIL